MSSKSSATTSKAHAKLVATGNNTIHDPTWDESDDDDDDDGVFHKGPPINSKATVHRSVVQTVDFGARIRRLAPFGIGR